MKLGFLGSGVITSAIVTGVCAEYGTEHSIFLSPRNKERAAGLAGRFKNVTVCGSNQEVIDNSTWVFIALVPLVAESALQELSFRPDHTVISLLSDRRISEVGKWVQPVRKIYRLIPMPFISERIGPIALYPSDPEPEKFFSKLGQVIMPDKEEHHEIMGAVTAVTSSTYVLLRHIVDWAESRGLPGDEALKYTVSYFESVIAQLHGEKAGNLNRLSEEMTPGGLNAMVLDSINGKDGFNLWPEALDTVLKRLTK